MAKGPSAWNVVTLLLVLGALTAGYIGWKFFPVYWTAWQVDHVLSDGAARAYSMTRLRSPLEQAKTKEALVRALRSEVVALGVPDPEMRLTLEIVDQRAELSCDYRAVVLYPVGDRFTMLPMHRAVSATVAPPRYDVK